MGFEVHNTTSQLNVQGSVLGYRQMANENSNCTWVSNDLNSTCTWDGPLVRYPPTNTQEALLLSGSRQWEAKDGIYSVAAFHTTENPAVLVEPSAPVISGNVTDDLDGTLGTSAVNFPLPGPAVGFANLRSMTGFRVHNIHQSGAIFSGLSNSTTLTLNWNVFLETFPSAAESEILPLATPSAEFDPDILDLYSRVVVDLPICVPVKENGLGDWFFDAVKTASKYIGPVLAGLPHPLAKGAGMALTGMSDFIESNAAKASTAPPNSWGPPPRAASKRAPGWQDASGMSKSKRPKKKVSQSAAAPKARSAVPRRRVRDRA